MPLSQSKEAVAEFKALLEEHLATLHPDYRRNPAVRGIRHEYVREVSPGVYASHNVLCKQGHYYHGFCLTYDTTYRNRWLYSIFQLGGRFDHNLSTTRAVHEHLGRSPVDPVDPFVMSASHGFRRGADRIIRRCLSEAETYVLPNYLEMWRGFEPSLSKIIDFARQNHLEVTTPSTRWTTDNLDTDMIGFANLCASCPDALQEELFEAVIYRKPDQFLWMFPKESAKANKRREGNG